MGFQNQMLMFGLPFRDRFNRFWVEPGHLQCFREDLRGVAIIENYCFRELPQRWPELGTTTLRAFSRWLSVNVSVVRSNGKYQISQIQWLQSDDTSLMTFLALQFCDSNCNVIFIVVFVL